MAVSGLPRQNSHANAGDIRDVGLIPGWGRFPGGSPGNPLQYSCLDNPMERYTWKAAVHWVAKSWTQMKRLSMHTHTQLSQEQKGKAAAGEEVEKLECCAFLLVT